MSFGLFQCAPPTGRHYGCLVTAVARLWGSSRKRKRRLLQTREWRKEQQHSKKKCIETKLYIYATHVTGSGENHIENLSLNNLNNK